MKHDLFSGQKSIRKRTFIILLIEAVILTVLAVGIAQQNRVIDTSISDWQSAFIEYRDGWYIDEDISSVDGEEGILYGPFIPLKKGVYSVSIEYECSISQNCFLYASAGSQIYETGKTIELRKDRMNIVCNITLEKDVQDFEVIPMYNGQGTLRINNIVIRHVPDLLQKIFLVFFLFFISFDLWMHFHVHVNDHIVCELCMITLLISLPLFMKGIRYGHDIIFHLARMEGLSEELREMNIPARLSAFVLNGYGYPTSVYYGDLLLYIPAVLRIFGISSIDAYKIYIAFINAGTTAIAYICFKKMFQRDDIALLLAFTYVTAGYRIVNVYARAAVGEYSAMMFLPVVALAVYRMYGKPCGQRTSYRKNAVILMLGMTGLIGTHILTTQMTVITLAIVCIVLWKKTFRKNVLCAYGLAIIGTIVLNLYFIIPFLDYYINVDVNINHAVNDTVLQNQKFGAYIGQYFAFFQSMFGVSNVDLSVRMGLTPGLVLMCTLVAAFALWLNKKLKREMKIYAAFSVGLLFAASNLFPWDYLAAHFQWGRWLAQVQYPWRYIGIAILFLTMLMGSILQYIIVNWEFAQAKQIYLLIASACIFMSVFFLSDYSNSDVLMMQDYDIAAHDAASVGMEDYLRYGTERSALWGKLLFKNMQEVSLLSREGHTMELYCRAGEINGYVEVPMLHYKGYRVMDEYGNQYKIEDGANNVIRFWLPAGFSGKVRIDFVEPWYWRMGELISVLAVMCLCVGCVVRRYMTVNKKRIRQSLE